MALWVIHKWIVFHDSTSFISIGLMRVPFAHGE